MSELQGKCWTEGGSYYRLLVVDGRHVYAHRFSYRENVGPLAKHKLVHHRCNTKACANPAHLTVKTRLGHIDLHRAEINAGRDRFFGAITHCVNGHLFDAENTRIRSNGRRECKACSRERTRAWRTRL